MPVDDTPVIIHCHLSGDTSVVIKCQLMTLQQVLVNEILCSL